MLLLYISQYSCDHLIFLSFVYMNVVILVFFSRMWAIAMYTKKFMSKVLQSIYGISVQLPVGKSKTFYLTLIAKLLQNFKHPSVCSFHMKLEECEFFVFLFDCLISHSYLVFGPKSSWSRVRHFCIATRASSSSTFKHFEA